MQRVCRLSSSSFSGRATLQKTSSSVKERYHFTSSLSSNMLFANNHGSPPAGRLFCSTQCWRALAYATTFSLGISLMSLQAKIESAGSINFCLQRHGSAGGAWRVASFEPNSHNCRGSLKDARTSLASFLESSFPCTANSSVQHSGVLHLSAFHGTHQLNSTTGGSGDVSLPSSSEVFGNPLKKEATIGFSSGGSSRSEPLPFNPCLTRLCLGVSGVAGGRLILKLDFVVPLLLALSTLSAVVPALRSGP